MHLLFPILALSVASASECPPFVPLGAVTASAEEAIRAFRAGDRDAFATARDTLRRDLGCTKALTADEAAAIHLALALDAFDRKDEVALDAHLRAVLALRPDFTLTADMAPPGGSLYLALRVARGPVSHTPIPVAAPCGGALAFDIDGEQASSWSGERAAIAQVFDDTINMMGIDSGRVYAEPAMRTEILLPGKGNPFVGMSCPTEPDDPEGRVIGLTALGMGLTAGAAWGYSAWHAAEAEAIAAGNFGELPDKYWRHDQRANIGSGVAFLVGGTSLMLGVTWIVLY